MSDLEQTLRAQSPMAEAWRMFRRNIPAMCGLIILIMIILTTLYGAFFANVFFGPIKTKLEGYTTYELNYRALVVEGLRQIARSESPRNIQDVLASSLPVKQREGLAAA